MSTTSTPMPPANPLILTLTLDRSTQSFLTGLRSKYFPPSRNFLTAHITLFHAIPAQRRSEFESHITSICAETSPWEVFITDPHKMGNRGVMVSVKERPYGTIGSIHQEFLRLLKNGSKSEEDRLTNQDATVLRKAHVTILNKAKDEEEIEGCLKEVQEVFEGLKGQEGGLPQKKGKAIGFELWEYMGGPWKHLKGFYFEGADPSQGGHQ